MREVVKRGWKVITKTWNKGIRIGNKINLSNSGIIRQENFFFARFLRFRNYDPFLFEKYQVVKNDDETIYNYHENLEYEIRIGKKLMFLTSISFVNNKPFLFEKYQNVWPLKRLAVQESTNALLLSFSPSLSLSLSSRRGGSRLIINQTCWCDTRGKARLSPALRPRGRESQRGVVTRLGRVFRGKENASRPINSGRESGRAESPHDSPLSLSLSRRHLFSSVLDPSSLHPPL